VLAKKTGAEGRKGKTSAHIWIGAPPPEGKKNRHVPTERGGRGAHRRKRKKKILSMHQKKGISSVLRKARRWQENRSGVRILPKSFTIAGVPKEKVSNSRISSKKGKINN